MQIGNHQIRNTLQQQHHHQQNFLSPSDQNDLRSQFSSNQNQNENLQVLDEHISNSIINQEDRQTQFGIGVQAKSTLDKKILTLNSTISNPQADANKLHLLQIPLQRLENTHGSSVEQTNEKTFSKMVQNQDENFFNNTNLERNNNISLQDQRKLIENKSKDLKCHCLICFSCCSLMGTCLRSRKISYNQANFNNGGKRREPPDYQLKIHNKVKLIDPNSLYIFSPNNTLRKAILWLIEWKYFDYFIIFCIIVNSLALSIYDYGDRDDISSKNQVIQIIGYGCTVIFLIECIFKIIGYGFIVHKNSYIRDFWNVIDLFIVVTGVMDMTFAEFQFKSLRSLRVLRPLKSINSIPGMRRLIKTLISSLPYIANVWIFLFFVILIFAIIGLQQFNGDIYNRCRLTEKPINATYWPINRNFTTPCSKSSDGSFQCPNGQFGIAFFDNFLQSLLGVFQIMARNNWSVIMLNLMNAGHTLYASIYVVSVVYICAYFLSNLLLAVIMESFMKIQSKELMDQIQENKKNNNNNGDMMNVIDRNLKDIQSQVEEFLKQENAFKAQTLQRQTCKQLNLITMQPFEKKVSQNGVNQPQWQNQSENQDISSDHLRQNQQPGDDHLIDFKMKEEQEQTDGVQSNNVIIMAVINKIKQGINKLDQITLEKSEFFKRLYGQIAQINDTNTKVRLHNQVLKENDMILKEIQNHMREKFIKRKTVNEYGFTKEKDIKLALKRSIVIKIQEKKEEELKFQEETRQISLPFNNPVQNEPEAEDRAIIDIPLQIKRSPKLLKLPQQSKQRQDILLALEVQKEMKFEYEKQKLMAKVFQKNREIMVNHKRLEDIRDIAKHSMNSEVLNKRAAKSKLFQWSLKICKNKWFDIIINICIISNTVVLAIDRYPISDEQNATLDTLNIIFYTIFLVEFIIKILGLGFKHYFQSKYNVFDAAMILLSTIDITMGAVLMGGGGVTLSALRGFRLLRIFKLARTWRKLQNLIHTITQTMKDVSTFTILLFLFTFVYTLLGLELFAYKVKFNQQNAFDMTSDDASEPLYNFDTFLDSFVSVFVVLTGENYSGIYYDYYRSLGPFTSSLYFLSLIIIGQYILLNLFLAILLNNFDEDSFATESVIEQKEASLWKKLQQKIRNSGCCKKKQSDGGRESSNQVSVQVNSCVVSKSQLEQQGNSANESPVVAKKKDRSLYIFDDNNKFRMLIMNVVSSQKFDYFILILIAISSIQLALDNPLLDPNSNLYQGIKYLDIALTSIFSLECFLKIIAFGLCLNGPNSYMRVTWNVIDFIIVGFSIISAVKISGSLNVVKIFRILRVVRPLRVISKNEGLKASIQSLIMAIPRIINVLLITFLFFGIFAIIGVNYLKGLFYNCNTTSIKELPNSDFLIKNLNTKLDCINAGGEWYVSFNNFDNAGKALFTLFQCSMSYGWQVLMYQAMYSTQIDYMPSKMASPQYSSYFIIFVIVGQFFSLNLFVGVVISTFNREKEKLGQNHMLSEKQKQWLETKLLIIKCKPKLYIIEPKQKWRIIFYKIAMHQYFDYLIIFAILISTINLTVKWYAEPVIIDTITDNINTGFTFFFAMEVIIKLIAFDAKFFKDGWNIFDFIIVLFTLVIVIITYSANNIRFGSQMNAIRTFRIGRILKLFKSLKSLKIMFQTFILTLPGLANVGSLLFLVFYMYAVLGVQLFADIKLSGVLSNILNFQSIGAAFLTLITVATGDSSDQVIEALSQGKTYWFDCIPEPTYDDYVLNEYQSVGCGSGTIVYVYMMSFIIFVTFIFQNLFIAIVLQGFQDITNQNKKILSPDLQDYFRDVWSKYDQDATGFIKTQDLAAFLMELGDPLGFDQSFLNNDSKQSQFITTLSLPSHNDETQYSFMDVLEGLALLLAVKKEIAVYMEKIERENNSQQTNKTVQDLQDQDIESEKPGKKLSSILQLPISENLKQKSLIIKQKLFSQMQRDRKNETVRRLQKSYHKHNYPINTSLSLKDQVAEESKADYRDHVSSNADEDDFQMNQNQSQMLPNREDVTNISNNLIPEGGDYSQNINALFNNSHAQFLNPNKNFNEQSYYHDPNPIQNDQNNGDVTSTHFKNQGLINIQHINIVKPSFPDQHELQYPEDHDVRFYIQQRWHNSSFEILHGMRQINDEVEDEEAQSVKNLKEIRQKSKKRRSNH